MTEVSRAWRRLAPRALFIPLLLVILSAKSVVPNKAVAEPKVWHHIAEEETCEHFLADFVDLCRFSTVPSHDSLCTDAYAWKAARVDCMIEGIELCIAAGDQDTGILLQGVAKEFVAMEQPCMSEEDHRKIEEAEAQSIQDALVAHRTQKTLTLNQARKRFKVEGDKRDLFASCSNGMIKLCKKELAKGQSAQSIATETETSLVFLAAENGNPDVVRAILDAGADPYIGDKRGYLPLDVAMDVGHAAVVHALFDAGVDDRVHEDGYFALHRAAWSGHPALVAAVLQQHPSKYPMGLETHSIQLGQTLLMGAALTNSDTIKSLLNAGANVDTKDFKGRTALYIAVEGDLNKLKEALKANPDIASSPQSMPAKCTKTAKLLVAHGADPHAAAKDETTPYTLSVELAKLTNRDKHHLFPGPPDSHPHEEL